ncbi:BTB/POZ domain-containing protein KCTD6-like isoform X2 [Mercenaria mercenaria]|uniref:BTB/POZ domain-containing protein KCTD6-like isoform X2 n=1 Tax=Mercenaria mercenaria TaxID=6596 RepID=UPI00234E4C35|nr:BTB/POZ domain-containing protein KCTD6-like isoform X2 [Mercenaria mercenaria]
MDTTTFPDVVELNIGGKLVTTLLATLRKDPESMLAAMFSGRHVISKDKDGRFFIDCDVNLFGHILNFLRFGTLPPKEKALEIYDIAVYFNLQPLVHSLDNYHAVQYRRRIVEMRNNLDMQEYESLKKDALEQLYIHCARPEDDIIVLFVRNVRCQAECVGGRRDFDLFNALKGKFKVVLLKSNIKEKEMKFYIANTLNEMGFGKYIYIDKHVPLYFECRRCWVRADTSNTALLSLKLQ